jgi:hypothetical protein
MPRYHFDLVDHVTVEDHGGQLFTDDRAATLAADDLAQQIFEVRPELRVRDILFSSGMPGGLKSIARPFVKMQSRICTGALPNSLFAVQFIYETDQS